MLLRIDRRSAAGRVANLYTLCADNSVTALNSAVVCIILGKTACASTAKLHGLQLARIYGKWEDKYHNIDREMPLRCCPRDGGMREDLGLKFICLSW